MPKINADGFEPGKELSHDDILAMRGKSEKPKPNDNSAPKSPDDIASMRKGEVREWLEAHGFEVEPGMAVDQMRDALTKVMFVDLDG